MFSRLGPMEIGLIVFIVLILFGAGKLPQVGSAMGKGIRAFRRGQSGADEPEEEEEETRAPVKSTRKKTSRPKRATSKEA